MTIAPGEIILASDILAIQATANAALVGGVLSLTASANGLSVSLPAGAVVQQILFSERAGQSVAVSLGTTNGAADVMAALTVPAGGQLPVTALSLLQQVFATDQPVFLSSAAWNAAIITMRVWYVV